MLVKLMFSMIKNVSYIRKKSRRIQNVMDGKLRKS